MRLTYRGYNDVPLLKTDAEQTEVIEKLAAYEDTGFEPDEIKEKVGFMSPVCVGCDGKTADGKRTEKCTYDEDFRKCLERSVHLSELAHAEEQGRLVILPVKAGDTVYQLRDKKHALNIGVHPRHISCVCVYGNDWIAEHQGDKPCMKKDLGKTWFLSREKAEAALKGERENV